jgi:hypothetical protein
MPGQIPGGGGRLHQSATCSARREAGLIFHEEVGLELRRKKALHVITMLYSRSRVRDARLLELLEFLVLLSLNVLQT